MMTVAMSTVLTDGVLLLRKAEQVMLFSPTSSSLSVRTRLEKNTIPLAESTGPSWTTVPFLSHTILGGGLASTEQVNSVVFGSFELPSNRKVCISGKILMFSSAWTVMFVSITDDSGWVAGVSTMAVHWKLWVPTPSSVTLTVRVEKAVSMNPVGAWSPSSTVTPSLLHWSSGRGWALTEQLRDTNSSSTPRVTVLREGKISNVETSKTANETKQEG